MAKWIQKAGIKKGALSRQLDIPIEKNIPIGLLNKIIKAEAGDTITNPYKVGKKRIKVISRWSGWFSYWSSGFKINT